MLGQHELMVRSEPYRSRFISRVDIGEPDACWLWKGAISGSGYGAMSVGGRKTPIALAHRLAWRLWRGEIENGLCVLHSCDVASCVNPHHLFLGTHQDNSDDKWAKGRDGTLRHDDHARAKLDMAHVREIRERYRPHVCTQKMLAEEFGVSRSTIRNITLMKSWVGVPSL